MTTSDLPPRHGHAPALRCSKLLNYPDESTQCPNEATWHVIWRLSLADLSNGLCCDEHHAEALRSWTPYATHRREETCDMVGAARYLPPPDNRCVVDDTDLGLDDEAVTLAGAIGERL